MCIQIALKITLSKAKLQTHTHSLSLFLRVLTLFYHYVPSSSFHSCIVLVKLFNISCWVVVICWACVFMGLCFICECQFLNQGFDKVFVNSFYLFRFCPFLYRRIINSVYLFFFWSFHFLFCFVNKAQLSFILRIFSYWVSLAFNLKKERSFS
jgi:hypothetical protein